jgi:hypothetical protein
VYRLLSVSITFQATRPSPLDERYISLEADLSNNKLLTNTIAEHIVIARNTG